MFGDLWILQHWFSARSKHLHNMKIVCIPIWRSLLLPHRVYKSSVLFWVCCVGIHFSFLSLDCVHLYHNISITADLKVLVWDLSYCNLMENLDPCICRSTDVCFTSAAPLSEYRIVLQMLSGYCARTFQISMMYSESELQKTFCNLFYTLGIMVWKGSSVTRLQF